MQRASTSAQSGPQATPDSFAELQSSVRRLEQSLRQVIRGKTEAVRQTLVALLSEGHLLIEDVPGVGKNHTGPCLGAQPELQVSAGAVHQRSVAERRHRHLRLQPASGKF